MKRYVKLLLVSLIALAFVAAVGIGQKDNEKEKENVQIFDVPMHKSLDVGELLQSNGLEQVNAFFPDPPLPKSFDVAVYLPQMFLLEEHFGGISTDVLENDFDNALDHYNKFEDEYRESKKLVPQWAGYFPERPLKELESALKTREMGKSMAAIEKMGKTCHNCHVVNMPKVQQKYHWNTIAGGTFAEIQVDGLGFTRLMQVLGGSFGGIRTDLVEGQPENAKAQFQNFNATFQLMKDTCKECHVSERKYYIDSSVQDMIDDLGDALDETPIDMTKVGGLSGGIGVESCYKCHLVHVPAAFAQLRSR